MVGVPVVAARGGAGLAAPGADLAARREPAGDAEAADVLAADRAGARGRVCTCTGCRRPRTRASAPPAYPGLLLTMVGLVIAGPWFTWATARLFGSAVTGAAAAAREPAAGRQPEGGLPVGDRAGARRLPRHDGGHAGARGERDRGDADQRARSATCCSTRSGCPGRPPPGCSAGSSAIGGATVYPFYVAGTRRPGCDRRRTERRSSGSGAGRGGGGSGSGPGSGSGRQRAQRSARAASAGRARPADRRRDAW